MARAMVVAGPERNLAVAGDKPTAVTWALEMGKTAAGR
jgi:hypothetical protein